MAWQDWVSKTTTAASNSYYKIVLNWRYRRDAVANKFQVNTQSMTITSLNSSYSFTSSSVVVGFWSPDTPSDEGKTSTQSITCSAKGSVEVNTYDTTVEFNGTTSGDFPSGKSFKWKFSPNITITGFPVSSTSSWQTTSVSGITSIDRSAGTGSITTSKSYSKITATYKVAYASNVYMKLNTESTYTKVGSLGTDGGTLSKTWTDLTPSTAYTVQGYHIRTYNEVQGSTVSASVTTSSIANPSLPDITIDNVTSNSFRLIMASGGTVYDSTTTRDDIAGELTYTINGETIETTATKLRAGITIENLESNTLYVVIVRTVAPITENVAAANAFTTTLSAYTIDFGTVTLTPQANAIVGVGTNATIYDTTEGGSLIATITDTQGTVIGTEEILKSSTNGYTFYIGDLEPNTPYTLTLVCTAPDNTTKTYTQEFTTRTEQSNLVYIRTANGWQTGTPYIRTDTGWQEGTPYIHTANGWEESKS